MKIKIDNFGPIDSFTIDLDKDLHLIFGENGIGKSYAVYCVYSLIKNLIDIRFLELDYLFNDNQGESTFPTNMFKEKNNYNEEIKVNEEIERVICQTMDSQMSDRLGNSFINSFDSLDNIRNRYSNKSYKIELLFNDFNVLITANKDGYPIVSKIKLNKDISTILKNTKTTKYSLYVDGKKEFGVADKNEFNVKFNKYIKKLEDSIKREFENITKRVYFLPASRSGLYQGLNSLSSIVAELSQHRHQLNGAQIQLPSLAEPLADYFLAISSVRTFMINTTYDEIVEEIENNIIKGEVYFDSETKKIMFKSKDVDLTLDVAQASSMVAELSPIIIFLKYIMSTQGTILFIEEPEAHLHPNSQVQLMMIFAKLSKLNVKVIMTSHSNYIFNKMNNIILSKEIDYDKVSVSHLIRGKKGAIINPNMISTSEGIDDENFVDVSRDIYNERMNILSQDE